MATAKKKPSAKTNVKYAAKTQSTARATSPAQNTNSNWVSGNAAEWQKGASDWAKQSAKLYQLPFAQGDVGAVTQKAAESVKSATENMVKMGSDMMQQMFGPQQQQAKAASAQAALDPAAMFKQFQQQMPQMPNMGQMPQMPGLDMAAATEKLNGFARETSEHLNKASQSANRAAAEAVEVSRENLQAVTEILNVATSVGKELATEVVSYLNKQFAQNVELGKQLHQCRTLNDMFDLSTRITKANLDAFFSESVKVSEMVFQCATDVSEPLNARISESTARMTKAMAS